MREHATLKSLPNSQTLTKSSAPRFSQLDSRMYSKTCLHNLHRFEEYWQFESQYLADKSGPIQSTNRVAEIRLCGIVASENLTSLRGFPGRPRVLLAGAQANLDKLG